MSAFQNADVLILTGCLGLMEFGTLVLSVNGVGTRHGVQARQDCLDTILSRARRHRVDRWLRVAPLMIMVSISLVCVGVILRLASAL